MEWLKIVIQLVIALSIFNVWLVRFNKPTSWRGGSAQNMKEEFMAYGLPDSFMKIIASLKILLASLLVIGIFVPSLVKPAASGMAILMLGAIAMHLKIKDAPMKSLPAFIFLVLSLYLVFA
jgi:hypothetical protein